MTTSTAVPPAPPTDGTGQRVRRPRPESHARGTVTTGYITKLILVALVDALGVYGILAGTAHSSWGIVGFLAFALIAVNLVYFVPSKKLIPAKYLIPGLLFLLVYQVFVVLYTGYTAFTNWGDGHNSTKEDSITAILSQNERRVEGSATYSLSVVEKDGVLGFAVLAPKGAPEVGTPTEPLTKVPDATVKDGVITAVPGYSVLTFNGIVQHQEEITNLRVPVSDSPADGSIRTTDGSTGFLYRSDYTYDAATGVLAGPDKTYRSDDAVGNFVDPSGKKIEPGWKVNVGFKNFTDVLTEPGLRGPFAGVLVWTFAFAILSVALSFGLGLFLAIALNHPRVRGQRLYRSLLILPYAMPAFLSTVVWAGMFNQSFGFINNVLLHGASVPWLNDPWLAKGAVLMVNLWLGFPYMFLICTGALQSIPADTIEAAKMDGASAPRLFRSITMPLLLVSTAPLLIASFAFNFNNFNVIYLITQNRQYGLACAVSILIFIIVASISAATFRKTRALEDLN
jgi:arabinogalactan oligomer/maltooligosaccharide transport system permease protein